MAPSAVATPKLLRDPGYLFWAPVGTAEPAHTATASVFSDAWPVAWIPMGATQEGTTFGWESPFEPIYAAEFLTPLAYAAGEQTGSIAFSLLDFTVMTLKRAMNGGVITTTGTTGTEVNKFEPPDVSAIVRCMIGWESLDNTMRFIGRQCINASKVEAAFKKGTDVAAVPCEFNFEKPTATTSWAFYGTSVRKGV